MGSKVIVTERQNEHFFRKSDGSGMGSQEVTELFWGIALT